MAPIISGINAGNIITTHNHTIMSIKFSISSYSQFSKSRSESISILDFLISLLMNVFTSPFLSCNSSMLFQIFETIFSETQKRFGDFMKFVDNLKDLDKALRDLTSDLDSLKTRATNFADKKDVENLVIRFNNFEKHISGLILLSNKKFRGVEKDLNNRFDERVEKIGKLLSGFELLAQKTPDLDKYFNLLDEEAKKMPRDFTKIEKIKVPGEEEKEGEEEEKEKKPSLFKKLKDKIIKKEGKE